MKKLKMMGMMAAGLSLALVGCDEAMSLQQGTGTVNPLVSVDPTVYRSRSPQAIEDVTVDDLQLTLTSEDGSRVYGPYAYADFPTNQGFEVGNYTLTATCGNPDEEGFEKPSVSGEADFTVVEGKATNVSLEAIPDKAMFSISFDEALTGYMSSLSAKVHTAGGADFDYSSSETKPLYIKPGTTSVSVDFVKPNGKGGTFEVASVNAEARHHYSLTVNMAGEGSGSIEGITVVFDETLETEDVTIDISDDVLSVPAPVITANGFESGKEYVIIEGSGATDLNPVFDILARGGIAKAVLTTASNSLIEQGWPAEVDLCAASASQLAAMTALGMEERGLSRNPDKMARLDLGKVLTHVNSTVASGPASTFSLVVTDQNGRQSEPVGFSFKVETFELLISYEGLYTGGETIDLNMSYNGPDPAANIKVQALVESGSWADATIQSITESRANYTLSVKLPAKAQNPIHLRAMLKDGSHPTEELTIAVPTVTLNAPANDVYATHAWVNVSCPEIDNIGSANIEVYAAKGSSTNYVKMAGTQDGAYYHATGFEPSATYSVYATVGSIKSTTATITTEAATQIENGNMDVWSTKTIGSSITYSWTNYTPGAPWSTFNDMTLSAYNTTYGQRTAASSTESTTDAHSGTAAKILNVGWGKYRTTQGDDVANRTIGELFLGSFAYSGTTPNPSYGTPFSSRPSGLRFWYKYTEFKSGEKGSIEISVYDNSGNEIAKGSKTVSAQNSYIQDTVNITYSKNSAKAASISVRFRASDQTTIDKDYLSSCGSSLTKQWLGAALYIDDVELVY